MASHKNNTRWHTAPLNVLVSIFTSISEFIPSCTCVCVCVHLCMCVSVCICVCVSVCMYVCTLQYVCTYVCIQVYVHIVRRYDQSVEIILKDWILQRMITEKRRVSHKELKQKALELVLPYNPNFQASQSWIRSFLLRNDISLNAMARSIRYSKAKTARKKNGKIAGTHHCTVKSQKYQRQKGHSRNQDSETSSMLEQQENTRPLSGVQRHHDNVFNLTHTFTQGLQKIGRPRELLNQDISWKVFIIFRIVSEFHWTKVL